MAQIPSSGSCFAVGFGGAFVGVFGLTGLAEGWGVGGAAGAVVAEGLAALNEGVGASAGEEVGAIDAEATASVEGGTGASDAGAGGAVSPRAQVK